jgi:hypothetical protein
MSQKALHHLPHLRKKPRNDDEPLDSSSFATPKKKNQRDDKEPGKLTVICYTWEKKQRNDN